MISIRGLENRIRDAFSVIKEEIITLKNSFLTQKDKNSEFEKKIEVLDNRINGLIDNIEELRRGNDVLGDIHDLKKDLEDVKKELKTIKKGEAKNKRIEEEPIIEKKDNLMVIFWVLLIVLIVVVSVGLYYDWFGVFNTQDNLNGNFFKVLNVKEGDLVKLDVGAKDEDNDNLFITYSGPLNSDGEWQTKEGDKGEYSVTVTVSDGKETVSKDVKIIVG